MREIKFRGKTVSTKEWVYGDLVHNAFNGHRIFPVGIQIPGCYPDEVIAETVGQFTGLHDKNGKEIYEGDYKIHCGKRCVCVYDETRARYIWSLEIPNKNAAFIYDIYSYDEVIGNIHENPESLEVPC